MDIYVIMWDKGPKNPNNTKEDRVYILNICRTDNIILNIEGLISMWRDPDISILRMGYKQLPIDTDIIAYMESIHKKYGGVIQGGGRENIQEYIDANLRITKSIAFFGNQREAARRFMLEENLTMD